MPDHRFFMTSDGVRIAYAEHGSGPPLIYVRGWLSHLDLLWERPGYRAFIKALSAHFRVVRFDMRGNGLSDRDVSQISLQALTAELRDLLDHLGIEKAILWGATFGGPVAIRFAAQHPERVERLLLDGTYAKGAAITQPIRRILLVNALRFFPEMGFLLLSNATHPNPKRSAQRTLELGNQMVNPKTGARLYRLAFRIDVQRYLKQIRMPVLVVHAMRSRSIPARLGQEVAALIPHAEFVGLDSDEHNSWEGDLEAFLNAVSPFLGVKLLPDAAPRLYDSVQPQPIPDEPFLFVCYSHLDEAKIADVLELLEIQGISTWIDSSISPGAVWREQIARAVQECQVFLLFASKRSLASPHCLQEINFAVDENRSILVVYLEDVQLPASLRMTLGARQAMHLEGQSRERFSAMLRKGVAELMESAV
jgi:pimeloyl-ACP methyl ester carboxylesterase